MSKKVQMQKPKPTVKQSPLDALIRQIDGLPYDEKVLLMKRLAHEVHGVRLYTANEAKAIASELLIKMAERDRDERQLASLGVLR